jgi:hypothetical protein
VLVGVSEYTTLERLPSVANNVATLRGGLTAADLWGLPDEHCVTLLNPTSPVQVLEAVHTAAEAATDVLLFYFAGHGLLDDRSDLHLALPGSDNDRLYRAVRYDDVRREVIGATRAFGKVVILDCCFSGRAMQGGMSGSVDLADHARVEGTYLMTATAETKLALAPPGEEYTAFTGALIDTMLHGVPDGPDPLDMETLFYHVRADLQARHLPVPQQRTRNDGKAIALVRNRRASGRGAARELAVRARELPQPPAGFEALRRWPPNELATRVDELRLNGDDDIADQLLAASAALRADQEVAAIIDLLCWRERFTDLWKVLTAAASRPPVEVLRIIDALRDTDLPSEASQLLRVAGAAATEDVAGLARLLRTRGRDEDLVVLLDTALDTAQEQSSLIGLVSALWMAGLRKEVDGLVNRAMSKLSGRAAVDLADELRAVGREETAFGLYVAAADTVATTRPVDAVAQLCQAMIGTDRHDDGHRIAQAVITTVDGVKRALDVAQAFWTIGRDNYAGQALERAAVTLPATDVLALAAELHAHGRDQAAYDVCLRAIVHRPGSIQETIAALRDAGRPVDAKKLIEAVAGQVPIRTVFDLLTDCGDADRERVLATAVLREPHEVAELLDTLRPAQPVIAKRLISLMSATMASRAEFLPILLRQVDPQQKQEILEWTVSTGDGQLVLDRLSAAGLEQYADAVLDEAAASQRREHHIAAYVASLCQPGPSPAGNVLLAKAMEGRNLKQAKELVDTLRQHNHGAALPAVASWVRTTTDGEPNINYRLLQLGLREYADIKRRRR